MKKYPPLKVMEKLNQKGAVIVLVAFLLIVFIGMAALVLDIGHLYVVRNELQNGADAGALAGINALYLNDGTVNPAANSVAADAAAQNKSEKITVELIYDSGNNAGDVQRGHWSFATRTFTPNDSLAAYDITGVSEADLDADTDLVNAVKVIVRRQDTPASSFFARIFGFEDFGVSAEAIAYLGFAGTLAPAEVDQPIAICEDTILEDGNYSCNIGRMINSGQNETNNETGGWTDFNQENPCTGGTNANIVNSLICSGGNPNQIDLGKAMATNGGQISSAFSSFRNCWLAATGGSSSWNITLPVVSCPDNNIGPCSETRGAVNVNVVWITEVGEDPNYNNVPTQVDDWDGSVITEDLNGDGEIDGEDRWESFIDHFNLQNVDGSDAPYQKKAIYFKPDCTFHEPTGTTGGENFNILAERGVLVD